MTNDKVIALSHMEGGQSGVVAHIEGGQGLVNRLNALGIRPGKGITKVSSMLMRGPITIQIDSIQVAIGFGMAKRIIVRPD